MALKVAVSPFFGGENWHDEVSGITFEKSKYHTLNVYDISSVTADKLGGIRKAILLNALILMEGSLDVDAAAPVQEPAKEEVKVEEPAVEEAPEAPATEEVVDEEPKAEVKKPASKKK